MRRASVLLGFFIVVLVALAPLSATVVAPVEFREVVADAGLIVRGTVTDVRVLPGAGGVESVATVVVDAVLKGDAGGAFVSVRVPGGAFGRYRQVMVGAPTLRRGQRAVFFLKRGADAGWRPIGLSAGVARVDEEPSTRRAVVRSALLAASATGARRAVRGQAQRPLPVEEFDALVRVMVVVGRTATGRAR